VSRLSVAAREKFVGCDNSRTLCMLRQKDGVVGGMRAGEDDRKRSKAVCRWQQDNIGWSLAEI